MSAQLKRMCAQRKGERKAPKPGIRVGVRKLDIGHAVSTATVPYRRTAIFLGEYSTVRASVQTVGFEPFASLAGDGLV